MQENTTQENAEEQEINLPSVPTAKEHTRPVIGNARNSPEKRKHQLRGEKEEQHHH